MRHDSSTGRALLGVAQPSCLQQPGGLHHNLRAAWSAAGGIILAWLAVSSASAAPWAQAPAAESGPALPASVDLRPEFERLGLAPRRQGDRPTCSVFTMVGALEFALARQPGGCPRLSVEFLNWAANQVCGQAHDGGFFSDLWKGFAALGVCAESNLPYQAKFDPALSPPAQALAEAKTRLGLGLQFHWIKEWNVHTGLTEAQLTAIRQTLADGWPVCAGLRWPKQEQWVDDVLQMCPSNAVRDGHSVLLVGYRTDASQPGGGLLLLRNSSRQGRDGAMPYAYAQAYMNDAAWVSSPPHRRHAQAGSNGDFSVAAPPGRPPTVAAPQGQQSTLATAPAWSTWWRQAPPLPAPTGEVIRVTSVDDLYAAMAQVRPGGTVLLADGHYWLLRCLRLRTDRVTLRSESGDRTRVILDGARCRDGELVALHACAGVTLADLTVQNVRHNGIKINSDSNVQQVTIYNCVLRNVWQRAVKGVKVPLDRREEFSPAGCRVQYCLFINDRPKRYEDDPADTPENFGGNYVGGIDVMYARGWTIADNVFWGIQGRTRSARGAVFLWHETQDCVIERNLIVDCDTGIALGNSHKPAEVPVHAIRCVVRNNFITRAPENGIVADYTRDCQIVHNTIHDPANRLGRLIRLVHDNDGLLVANNLLSGPPLRNESTRRMTLRDNPSADLTPHFMDAANGNLRLRAPLPETLPRVSAIPGVTEDIDRQPRRDPPTVGADEPD